MTALDGEQTPSDFSFPLALSIYLLILERAANKKRLRLPAPTRKVLRKWLQVHETEILRKLRELKRPSAPVDLNTLTLSKLISYTRPPARSKGVSK